jgi:formylglycine-generating enzyme required for sulfatase activity
MPIGRTRKLRVLYGQADADFAQHLAHLVEQLPDAINVDLSPAGASMERGTTAVVVVWSEASDRDVSVFREIQVWDRNNVPIHVLSARGAQVLSIVQELSASVAPVASTDTVVMGWLANTVLGLPAAADSEPNSDRRIENYREAVSYYNRSLAARLARIDVFGSSERERLEDIYLPLALAAANRRGVQVSDDDTSLVVLLQQRSGARLLVQGPPGGGKTTVLEYAALQIAREGSVSGDNIVVPVFIRAIDLVQLSTPSVAAHLQLVAKGVVPRQGRQVSRMIFESDEAADNDLVVFVDGLDEVQRDDRPVVRRALRAFETEFPDANVVISSRPSGVEEALWGDYEGWTLRPLNSDLVESYVNKFAPRGAGQPLLDLLAASEPLRDLAKIPFMLALMTATGVDSDHGATLRRATLVKECVDSLLRRRPLSEQSGLTPTELEECLGSLASRLFRLDSSGAHKESEVLYALEMQVEQLAGRRTRQLGVSSRDRSEQILDEIIERTGLLQRSGDAVEFIHRSIWEYFAGSHLVASSVGTFQQLALVPAWEEPIRLAVGLMSETEARATISALWERNAGLALRCVIETPADMSGEVGRLVAKLDAADQAGIVRDLGDLMAEPSQGGDPERTVIDTLRVLLPAIDSCEPLWEATETLLAIKLRTPEAIRLLHSIYKFDEMGDRLDELCRLPQTGVSFIAVPPGVFRMGSDAPSRSVDEHPSHAVELSAFEISKFTVCNVARALFPYKFGLRDDPRSPSVAHPAIGVTWYEAMVFATWFGCRLPTEAEWEYSCRSGGSDDLELSDEVQIPRYAWYAGNAGNETHEPGLLAGNSFGLFDMLGNVREWCSDWFSADYYRTCAERGSSTDPQGPLDGQQKVLRGGCFDWNTANLVPTYRNSNLPHNVGFQNGVRLVRGLSQMFDVVRADL